MSFSQLAELCNYPHNPILEYRHLPSEIPRACWQLITIPKATPRLMHIMSMSFSPLHFHVLGLFTSKCCIDWLPTCFPVWDNAWAISCPVEVGHKCTQVHTQTHTHTPHQQGSTVMPSPSSPSGRSPTLLQNASNPALLGLAKVSKAAGKTE